MHKRKKILTNWRKILVWVAVILTIAKVWLPESIISPLAEWTQKADSIVRSVQDLLNGKSKKMGSSQ